MRRSVRGRGRRPRVGSGSRRAAARGWLGVLLLGLLVAPRAGAQSTDEDSGLSGFEEEETDTTATPPEEGDEELLGDEDEDTGPRRPPGPGGVLEPDSTRSGQLLAPLHPSYNTTYTVTRQVTTWVQDFNFGAKIGFFNFDNKTDFSVRTDTGRDETLKEGSNLTNLRFFKIPLNAALDLGRTSLNNPTTEQQNDDLRLNLTTRDLRKRLFTVDHRVSVGGGLSHRSDDRLLSGKLSRSIDSGLEANASWRGSWDPSKMLRMNGDAKWSRIQKESRLVDSVTVSTPTANVNRAFGLRAHVEPWDWISSDLGATSTLSEDESYTTVPSAAGQPPTKQLELRSGNRRSFTATFQLFGAGKGKGLSFNLSQSVQDQDYRLRRDFAYTGDTFTWGSQLTTTWWATEVDVRINSSRDVLDRATSSGQETRNNVFEGKLQRELSKKFQARFNWLVRANQIFFDDVSLDRDELRTKFSPWIGFKPNNKWTIAASYTRSTTRRAEINPKQALQSREEEDYSVDVGISYHLSKQTNLRQQYAIKAIYTTFDYNPGSDRLLSTQRITTTLDSDLGPRVHFLFEHRFTLQDSGPFGFEADGTRVFARDLRKYRQELTADVTYRITSWASVLIRSLFLRTDDVNEYLNRRLTGRNMTLDTGINVQKTLRGAVKIQASGKYTQSSTTDSYWTLTSGLQKDF